MTDRLVSIENIRSGLGNDILVGSSADNMLSSGRGNDQLMGGAGNDRLFAGQGADRLNGGAGSDLLDGGADTLRDVFVFNAVGDSGLGANADRISNFVSGTDQIQLREIDANGSAAGNGTFAFSGTTAAANSVWYVAQGDNIRIFGDATGDGRADFSIVVSGIGAVTADDFLL